VLLEAGDLPTDAWSFACFEERLDFALFNSPSTLMLTLSENLSARLK
jgi:hypothetical protein